jgi:1-acyl-sn-glycerol-3-phosphate acyltransferase
MITISCYSFTVFAIGLCLTIIRPFHPNNIYTISRLLASKGFDILGISFEKRIVKKDLDYTQPAIFMSNHQNNIDLFVGGATIFPNTILLGKKSLLFIPLFGQFFVLAGCFLIDRKNPKRAKESMLRLTNKILKDKISVWIMPEGTRSKGKGLLPFKKGGFITAVNLQIPIVPVVFSSYAKKLKLNKKDSGKIISKILPPIPTKGLTLDDVDELMNKTHQLFQNTLEELDNELSNLT